MLLQDALRDPELIPYVRRWLFEQLTAGLLPAGQAVAVARRIGVELAAESYAVVLFDLPPRDREAEFYSDPAVRAREALLAYFLKYSEYMPAQLAPNTGAVLVKGDAGGVPALTDRCIRQVRTEYDRVGIAGWHLAASGPVAGLEELPAGYEQASRLWALRAIVPGRQVFLPGMERLADLPAEAGELPPVELSQVDPETVRTFLENGSLEDVPAFVERYLRQLSGAMDFRPLRDHVLLSARFTAERYVRSLGLPRERYTEKLGSWAEMSGEPARFLEQTLSAAVELREQAAGGSGTLGAALGYVDRRFAEPDLTLARTAAHAGVTASYLSALFQRELGRTYTQYVTELRMDLARRLLRTTDRRTGQIAREVGYRDARYFSALFKKTQGCTPSRFRAGEG